MVWSEKEKEVRLVSMVFSDGDLQPTISQTKDKNAVSLEEADTEASRQFDKD